MQSICDYLVAPNGTIEIYNNAPGCNSQLEVEDACASSINEIGAISTLIVSPNPFTTTTTFSYVLKQPSSVHLSVYNQLGQLVYQHSEEQQQGEQQLQWDAQSAAEGIYFYQLKVGDEVANGKMVKVK